MFYLKKSGEYNFLHQLSHKSISLDSLSSQCSSQRQLGKPVHPGMVVRNLYSKLTPLTLMSPHFPAHCSLASARATPQNRAVQQSIL